MREILEWLSGILGLNDSPGYQFAFTVISCVLVFMFTQLWIAHSNHKQDRRNYEYGRSQEVNKKRFNDELAATETLSGLFMKLRISTHNLRCCPVEQFEREGHRWRKLYNEAAYVLGKYAPVLNLRRQDDGAPTCGVHFRDRLLDDNALVDFHAIEGELSDGFISLCRKSSGGFAADGVRGGERDTIECRPSLYLRGVKFLDDCIAARQRALLDRSSGETYPFEPMSLYSPEEDRYKFISDEYCKPEGFNDADMDAKLAQSYKYFVNCAFCRLRNSDTGRKDARRINRQNARRKRLSKYFPRMNRHERECPHPNK